MAVGNDRPSQCRGGGGASAKVLSNSSGKTESTSSLSLVSLLPFDAGRWF